MEVAVDAYSQSSSCRQVTLRFLQKIQVKIIDHYLDLYNAREELVLSAVQAGVLSKSDELELRSLRNNTLSDRTTAVLAVSTAESFLKTTLSQHYDHGYVRSSHPT